MKKYISQNAKIDLGNLYRIPWTKFNNPTGWIEPTTFCQLACPGCYRGLDKPNPIRIHQDLIKLQEEVDTLIKIRRIETLAIAGGEPLTYPKLNEIISYAHNKGLKVKIITNGVALTKKRLLELKEIGTNEVVIHLASYQKRAGRTDEKAVKKIREGYCKLFKEVGGIDLQFIMTVTEDNLKNLPGIINFYKENSEIASHFLFTIYQNIWPQKTDEKTKLNVAKIANLIEAKYKIKPCAYLPKTLDQYTPSWLFYVAIFHGKQIIGYVDGKLAQTLFKKGVKTNNKDFFPIRHNKVDLLRSLNLIRQSSIGKILLQYFLSTLKNPKTILSLPHYQIIIILNTPDFNGKSWSLCDGCPDAILYKGDLVPSCLLERIKAGDKITLPG